VRKTGLGLLILAVIAVTFYFGLREFRHWSRIKLNTEARAFFEKGDFCSASLTARQAIRLDPKNAAMCRLMAQIADAVDSPEAIPWWSRVVQLEGARWSSVAPLVAAAMRFKETAVAEQALGQIPEGERKTVAYNQLMGACSVATRQLGLAEGYFSEAEKLAPQNVSIRLNLASVRLQSTRRETVDQARAALDQLRQDPQTSTAALRILLGDARSHADTGRALELARELADKPGGTFQDQIDYLEVLQDASSPEFPPRLAALQKAVEEKPAPVTVLARWMNNHNMAAQSLEWMNQQPAIVRIQMPVPLALSESLTALRKWDELRALVAKEKWWDLDFLRLAILARAARETSHKDEFKLKWENAIIETQGDVKLLSMLGRLVDGWGWTAEAEQVWWLIARHSTGQSAALHSLDKLYVRTKNTPGRCRVAERVYELDPGNPVAANNVAALSLLLGLNPEKAHRIALENYRKHPEVADIASTYAFSLYRQKKSGEGVEVLKSFPEAVLRQPSIAVYYGLVLASAGDRAGAQPFLDIAEKSPDLLPEESALIKQAK
jgi:Flp pilus assembly protein TadD